MWERRDGLGMAEMEDAVVDRREVGLLVFPFLSRLSVLPWTLRGGVSGCERGGRSVGRNAAGMYMGDLGGRSWRVARGREGKSGFGAFCCGELGEYGKGV